MVRTFILNKIQLVASQQNKQLAAFADSLALSETGLDSPRVATIVANLGDELGLDPFASGNVDMPVTVGEFIHLNENGTG